MIRVDNLHFSYGAFEALRGLSFSAAQGKITGVLGPNGSGKSTTFKILSTQLAPSEGEAWVNDFSVITQREQVRKSLGVTFQSPSLDPMLTVEENLQIHATLYSVPRAAARIEEMLGVLQLGDRRSSRVKSLSGGLARRVELAKTLLSKPSVLLLDEPTTGLDPLLRAEFWNELRRARDRGMTILVTTHLMDEAELCDDLIFLTEGKLAAQGTPGGLKEEFGADLITVESSGLKARIAGLREKLAAGDRLTENANSLRIESANPLRVLDLLRSELGTEIEHLNWGKPTLGDVYLSRTGKALS